ncbi:bifunctional phosphopantothenoylcysteine decarboxylase/phosphopantothenate--cysteine ligase CoaBC [Bacillota bacterium LX-D]|nr:bifunctional phosphopantothenoylcysteine decarboxylase/phosphopantothenate--cysteine ligase CoaBC [Bacillota bacterium LX-D]
MEKSSKTIIVGVTGGIAAYKSVELVSSLVKLGHEVHVILTKSAQDFITPLTFQTITKQHVWLDQLNLDREEYVPHVDLGAKADLVVIAPASANTIAKITWGLADNILTSTILATKAPILLAPAMNVNMYQNTVTQGNLNRLKELGCYFVEPEEGILACGVVGKGRLAATSKILEAIDRILYPNLDFLGKTVLITAGGTQEAIDPVRYIGNRSSGKMGFALAREAQRKGARVILVAGPTHIEPPLGVEYFPIVSSQEMYDKVLEFYSISDIVLMAAAVADYKPTISFTKKHKKESGNLVLGLQRTPDILFELGQNKKEQILVGFAAETEDLLANAEAKLNKKNLDLIVANDITKPGAGFNSDTNIVTLVFPNGKKVALPQLHKADIAAKILDAVTELPLFKLKKQ